MNYSILLTIICIIISGCSLSPSDSKTTTSGLYSGKTLYVLGDSLTAGYRLPLEESYPMVIEEKLKNLGHQLRVINGGESGDTSAGLKERIERIIADANSGDIALIVIGGNDGLQGLSIEELKNNIIEIVGKLQSQKLITIIGGMQIPTNLGEGYRNEFSQAYPIIASQTSSYLIPFILTGVAGIPDLNLPDGIHPNTTGQRIIANTVINFLLTNNILSR